MEWLMRAKAHLNNPRSRAASPTGFIYILDTVAVIDEMSMNGDYRMRPERHLRALFKAAGLIIQATSNGQVTYPYNKLCSMWILH